MENNEFKCIMTIERNIFQENESFTVEKNKEIVRTYEDFFNK